MKKKALVYVLLLTGLTSCFIADDIFSEQTYTMPLDIVVKDSITAYVKRNIHSDQEYLKYGFDELKIIVPKELAEFDKWSSRLGDANYNQDEVKRKIEEYKATVDDEKLERTLVMDHVFSLRSEGDSLGEIQKVKFLLTENLKVKEIKPSYNIQLTEDVEAVFAYFYYESPIIKSKAYEDSKILNEEFYTFFNIKLDDLTTIRERNDYLNHVLFICKYVLEQGEFDQQKVTEKIAESYMHLNRSDINDYKSIRFSELYQIKNYDNIEAYYFFHTFSYENQSETDSMRVYVKFSSHYELQSVFEAE